jgi:tetratricopeptide (TPR) repeat protein
VIHLVDLGEANRSFKPDTSLRLAEEALTLSKRIGFNKGEASAYHLMGNAYRIVGNRPKAMETILLGLKINEKIDNKEGMEVDLLQLGIIYKELENYNEAIAYFLQSKKIDAQLNNKNTFIFLNLGDTYLRLKQYDSARFYSQQAYEIATKNNNVLAQASILAVMGGICSETGQKKLAMEYYRLSILYSKQSDNYRGLSVTFLNMADLFQLEEKKDSTLFYANQAFKISKTGRFSGILLNASNFLSLYYKKNGNKDSAFFYLELATALKDTLFKQQGINQLYSLAFDEKNRQSDIAAAELKAKEERNHNLQYAGIAIGLITFIILFFALSRSIIVKTKFIEFFGVLELLAVFEFINLLIHPYLAHITNDSPILMLGVLIGIGALLIPFHHKLEKWITNIMVEKNKKIRLAAAKKTIEQLEGKAE